MNFRALKGSLLLLALLAIAGGLVIIKLAFFKGTATKPNVLVILIDTLRADHLGIYGYERNTSPNIDRFARENLLYNRAISPAAWTPPSVASLFTGVYPSVHGHMPRPSGSKFGHHFTGIEDGFKTIAETLLEAGYSTAGITANPLIGKKYGLTQGFEQCYSPGREKGDKITRRAIKYLSEHRPKDRPFFLYLHYLDPHDPYLPPAPYKKLFSGDLKRPYGATELNLISQYDGEIKFVDDQIGELFTWLKDNDLYNDLVIVFVSDHGEQFRERGFQGHGDRLHSEEIHIPMIIKAPKRQGVISEVVSLVDIYPTLLDLLNISPQPDLQGISLLGDLSARKKEGVLTEIFRHYNLKAYTTSDGTRIIYEFPGERGLLLSDLSNPTSIEQFDLNSDAWEKNPIKAERPEAAVELYDRVKELAKKYKSVELPEDKEMLDELKTLGYL